VGVRDIVRDAEMYTFGHISSSDGERMTRRQWPHLHKQIGRVAGALNIYSSTAYHMLLVDESGPAQFVATAAPVAEGGLIRHPIPARASK
jgi:hypothetical protein